MTAPPGSGRAGCPFCAIVDGRAPGAIVRAWDDAVAIVPLRPVVPGHLLVLPRMHVADALANPHVTAQTMRRATELAHELGIGALNIITSVGAAATQTVFHLHIHLVPRALGDALALPWHPIDT